MIAQELRIGNLIQVGGNTIDTYQTYKPIAITAELIKAIQEENEERGNDYILSVWQPIPLTPEILEKAGFKHIDGWNDSWWYFDTVGVNLHLGKLYYNDLSKHVELHSLHQLQNLTFALTGQELTIKL